MPAHVHQALPPVLMIAFFHNYGRVQNLQLNGVCTSLNDSVMRIMTCVLKINILGNRMREISDSDLFNAHFNSDERTFLSIARTQKSVDDLIESLGGSDESISLIQDNLQSELRLKNGRVSKAAESLGRLSDDLAKPLINLSSLFSIEDVLGQRLLHVSQSIEFMTTLLGHIMQHVTSTPLTYQIVDQFKEQLFIKCSELFSQKREKIILERCLNSINSKPSCADHKTSCTNFFLQTVGQYIQINISQIQETRHLLNETVKQAFAIVAHVSDVVDKRKNYPHFPNERENENLTAEESSTLNLLLQAENEITSNIHSLISELAIEDIFNQRLVHVEFSLFEMQRLVYDLTKLGDNIEPKDFDTLTLQALRNVFGCYVMSAEINCFASVFDKITLAKD